MSAGAPLSAGPLVLCYHAVSERWPCELAIPPRRLESQLAGLLREGYQPVRFSELLSAPCEAKLLAVTFDDAFQSTWAHGLPVLRRLKIPATMFAPTAYVGRHALSWPGVEQWLEGEFAQELRPMSWTQLEDLAAEGWEIGSHSCTHARLTELPDGLLAEELRRSKQALEGRLGTRCRSFAYPFGAVDARVAAATAAAGYEIGAALPIRFADATRLTWPRVGIYRTDGRLRFGAKVSPTIRALRATPLAMPMLRAHKLALATSSRLAQALPGQSVRSAAPQAQRAPHRTAARKARQRASAPQTQQARHRASARQPRQRRPAVLLTDGEERSMLAATRALGASGYEVAVAAASKHAAAQCSRFCRRSVLLPDPRLDEEAYVQALERALGSGRYDVLMPGSDPALLIASERRDRLQRHVLIGLPPHEVVLRSLDKLALPELVQGTGLDVPETIACESVEEARAAGRELGYPVAIKPRSSAFRSGGRLKHVPGRIAASEEELLRVAPAYGQRFAVQRREAGTLLAFGGVFADGRLLSSAAARSWRTHRPASGSLAFCESIPVAPLRESVASLMSNVRHQGIFELDLLLRKDGSVALLDLNPRPYGAMALAIAGGANLPAIWCDWLLGRDAAQDRHSTAGAAPSRPSTAEAEPGLRFRWGDADLFHLLCRAREGRWRAAASVLLPHRHVTHAYFSATDPGPMLARALWLMGDLARHGLADRREIALRDR